MLRVKCIVSIIVWHTSMADDDPGAVPHTTSHFTKWRNWSQVLLAGLRDFLHVLSLDGRIIYACSSCKDILGYEPTALVGRFVWELIHPDDRNIFIQEFRESITFGNRTCFHYRFRKANNEWIIFESQGHLYIRTEPNRSLCNTYQREFIIMARPYPSKSGALFDSFLDLKMQEQKLLKCIADLKREEQNAPEAQTSRDQESQDEKHVVKGSKLQNRATVDSKNPSLSTDLHCGNDKGLATGVRMGDLGIAISNQRYSGAKTRPQKQRESKPKNIIRYMCATCNTVDSPEWRKGPAGPKTLCNACGRKSISCPPNRQA